MESKKMLFLVIIIFILGMGLGIYLGTKNIGLSSNKGTGTGYINDSMGTSFQSNKKSISYIDESGTRIFTNEDDFLTWFLSSGKTYNDIGNSISISGLNLAYILLTDFKKSTNEGEFDSFYKRNGVMALMVLLNKERSVDDIKLLVPEVFEILYKEKGDIFIASQNKVLGTTNLLKKDLKLSSINYAISRMKELSLTGFLKTDFTRIGFYNPVEIAVQDLDINGMMELCKKGVKNNEYDLAYCMDFIYLYRSSLKETYSKDIKSIFMRDLAESYNMFGLKKVGK